GNGGSVTAIVDGKCVDTSMGLTPLEGIVMGTRSGDVDASILFYMYNTLSMSMQEIDDTLNKKSGLLGITEVSNDCRYAEDNYDSNARAKLALDLYAYRLAKKVASYLVNFESLPDAIVFTGGIGENSSHVRSMTLEYLKVFGYKVDEAKNEAARFGKDGVISQENTPLALVIPTNEELMIARDTASICF
ncbi:MAG: acetate kinase, partial [Psittacicella sp.]